MYYSRDPRPLPDLFGPGTVDHANPKHLGMLKLMCEWGVNPDLVMALVELSGVMLTTADRRFLLGPMVIHDGGGWINDVPAWLYDLARAERLEIVLGTSKWLIGPGELTAVMMPAMYEAPRVGDLVDLYLWASSNAASRHYNKPVKDYWTMLAMAPIADADVLEQSGRLWHTYLNLSSVIRRNVETAQAERERSALEAQKERENRPPPRIVRQPARRLPADPQTTLFGIE